MHSVAVAVAADCILFWFFFFCFFCFFLFDRSFWSHLYKLKCNELYDKICTTVFVCMCISQWHYIYRERGRSVVRYTQIESSTTLELCVCNANFIYSLSIYIDGIKRQNRQKAFENYRTQEKKCNLKREREREITEIETDEKYSMAIILWASLDVCGCVSGCMFGRNLVQTYISLWWKSFCCHSI